MALISGEDGDGTLAEHGHADHYITVERGTVIDMKLTPTKDSGLLRTGLRVKAPGTHHVLADKFDVIKQSDGEQFMEWDSPQVGRALLVGRLSPLVPAPKLVHYSGLSQDEAGVDIDVDALEGAGAYHLESNIVGTIEYLSRFAILGAPVLLLIECTFFDDCTFRYDALEMRGDGSTGHGRYSHFHAACLFCMGNH
jgi:hypothetical protein